MSASLSATVERAGVARRLLAGLGARQRHDAGFGEQPGERDGRGIDAVRGGHRAQRVDDRLRRGDVVGGEPRGLGAEPLRQPAGAVLAGEQALLERAVREQGHAELAAGVEHAVDLRRAMQQRVVHLVARQRHAAARQRRVRLAHLARRGSC